jgi:hypothetical protein
MYPLGFRKTTKITVRITGGPAEFRTDIFRNTNEEHQFEPDMFGN